ncbi:DUF3152 domain-containing protein [Georgenia sp. AZ-5]|uniref:DUF3152 domain-containing protein n=1 Tax=Georgenia sp. AZ-5 TaxID=3367526 RepID=UPI003754E088
MSVPSLRRALAVLALAAAPALAGGVPAVAAPPAAPVALSPSGAERDGDERDARAGRPTGLPPKAALPWLRSSVESVLVAERHRAGLTADAVPESASGTLVVVPGSAEPPRDAAAVHTVRVEVEEGLPVDGARFADFVLGTLNDERGWGHDGSVAFARTDGSADHRVILASGALTDRLCHPLRTLGEVSCGTAGRAVLNAERWSDGAEPFQEGGGTVTAYRQYLVNHEVGHLLGHPHRACPAPGAVAPVMVQQTLGLGGCLPNGWPAP